MSLKKELYLSVKEAILKEIPSVKTFRLFNNQFDNENIENAFTYNAVFMQFENIDFIATTGGSQQGDLLVTFHVGLRSLKTEDLEVFDLLDELFKVLTDLNIGFTRVRESQDINHDSVQVWQQSYKVLMIDDTANIHDRKKKIVTVHDIEITKEIIIDPNAKEGIRTDNEIS